MDLLTDREIKTVIREACEKLGHPELARRITITINRRVKRRFGQAQCNTMNIEFGWYLFSNATRDERWDTITHETCHLVAFHKHGPCIKPHGDEWKKLARKAGCTPKSASKSHTVDESKPPARGMHRVHCGCGPKDVTTRFRNCLIRGKKYHCKGCKHTIALRKEDVVKYNRWAPVAPPVAPVQMAAKRAPTPPKDPEMSQEEMRAEIERLKKENADLRKTQEKPRRRRRRRS